MGTPNDPVVAQLWQYPVKSMRGERLPAVKVQADGLDGDRRWGVRDELTGRVLTGRREPGLLEATASLGEGNELAIELPDGTSVGAGDATDSALSDWLARPVRLVEAGAREERLVGDMAKLINSGTTSRPPRASSRSPTRENRRRNPHRLRSWLLDFGPSAAPVKLTSRPDAHGVRVDCAQVPTPRLSPSQWL